MKKIIVFQHVAHKILGTLDPILRQKGFRIRYVNYERDPEARPTLEKYHGLIILGGYMGVYEADRYQHIKVEMQLIEEALKKQIPILGICLGAQLLAHVLGSEIRKNHEKEIGWYDINLTDEGSVDPILSHFNKTEKLFQLHGDTFDIPKSAKHLASSQLCTGQAFSYNKNAYGLQFHLEVDQPMILRWLDHPSNQFDLQKFSIDQIKLDTEKNIKQSIRLSNQTFLNFINLFQLKEKIIRLGSEHAKPTRIK